MDDDGPVLQCWWIERDCTTAANYGKFRSSRNAMRENHPVQFVHGLGPSYSFCIGYITSQHGILQICHNLLALIPTAAQSNQLRRIRHGPRQSQLARHTTGTEATLFSAMLRIHT
jgi:hypothetical protein